MIESVRSIAIGLSNLFDYPYKIRLWRRTQEWGISPVSGGGI